MPIALSQLPRWGLVLAAAVAGSLTVLAFAPFSIWPLAVLAVAVFFQALERRTRRAALLAGWGFGLGLLGFGIFWIRISLNEFGNMPPLVAHLLTIVFVLAMALYYGLAGWLVRALGGVGPNAPTQDPLPHRAGLAGPLLIMPGVWVLLEWLRGWLFTGFPWLTLGYTQVDGPLGGLAPIVGVYGVSLAVVFSGGLLWLAVRAPGRARWIALAGLAALWAAGAGLRLVEWTRPAGAPLRASVIQANIQPSMKWDPEALLPILQAHLELTKERLGESDLIVWPETAVPAFLDEVRDDLIEPLAGTAREAGTAIVLGIPYRELDTGRYYNGLLSLGTGEDLYAKRHLVVFGEFMPFKTWLGPLVKYFQVPMSDFSRGAAGASTIRVNGIQVGASICYEDVFPEEVIQALPAAAYLINVSNDAWFGDSLAPYQHLEIARMRALEAGRPLVRATNTGVSAVIDHHGSLLGSIPLFDRAALTVEIQPRAGATPFVVVGNGLAIGLALVMAAAGAAIANFGRAGSPNPGRGDQATS
jgi:apolipoprotein N-acyltransferase